MHTLLPTSVLGIFYSISQVAKDDNGKGMGFNQLKEKILVSMAYESDRYRYRGELTIVASCFWLATFLILPMLTIGQTANHEDVEEVQEREVS